MEMQTLRSDSSRNEQLLSDTDYNIRLHQNKPFFRRHRPLMIFVIVLAAISLILFIVLSPLLFSAGQTVTHTTISSSRKRVVGYYTGERDLNKGQLQNLTHIIFAHLKLDMERVLKFESETSKEKFLVMKKKAREVNKDLKVMVSIGGWDQSMEFNRYFNDMFFRKNLMDFILSLVEEHQIDGVEIFWIHINPFVSSNYLEFVRKLRKRLISFQEETSRTSDILISIATSPFEGILEDTNWKILTNSQKQTRDSPPYFLEEIDLWKELIEEVEFINVLTYDYFNSIRSTFIGPTTPIYGGNRENLHSTMNYMISKTGNPQKLNLVVPSYGSYWTNVTLPFDENDFVWISPERYIQNWHLYELDREKQRVRFRNLKDFLKQWPGAEYHFHNESKSSYYWMPESKTFITMENEQSLREKVKYRNQMDIGGIGIMKIDEDDDENTLINVIAAENGKNTPGLVKCENFEDLKCLPPNFGNNLGVLLIIVCCFLIFNVFLE